MVGQEHDDRAFGEAGVLERPKHMADGVVAGVPFSRLDPAAGMDDVLLVAATETTTTQDIQTFAQALAGRTA